MFGSFHFAIDRTRFMQDKAYEYDHINLHVIDIIEEDKLPTFLPYFKWLGGNLSMITCCKHTGISQD